MVNQEHFKIIIMVDVIKNIADMESIKDSINNLADRYKLPLLRYEWLKNTADNTCPPAKLYFVIISNGSEIDAIAPLVLIRNNISERLEIIGTSLHKEPGGFLYKDAESLQLMLEVILKLKKPVFIKGIRIFSPESVLLEPILRNNKRFSLIKDSSIPFLPIAESWECFEKKISSSRRSSLKRLERIGKDMGDYKVEIFVPASDEVDKYITDVFEVEASGWKQRMGTAMKSNSRLGKFFQFYARDAAELGFLRLCFLKINNKPIAAQIGIVYAGRFWSLKIGYDEKYSKCSPGILMMNEMIRYSFNNKLEAVELLGSDEQWLHIWTNHIRRLITYNIYSSKINGAFDLFIDYSSSLLSKLEYQVIKRLNNSQLSNAKS